MVSVGWGIAGCGWVARDYVAPAIRGSVNGRIVALFDPDAAALARCAQAGEPGFSDLSAFLATPGLDAIYVAAPNHAHRALVEAAAAAGKPVLCEKPMATNLADATAMVEACRAAGVTYATAFDQRFHPAHRHLAHLIAGDRLGTVTAIRILYACWLPPGWTADNWRIDKTRAGGGAMIDLAPHGLDLASCLLGEDLCDITAIGQRRVHSYAVEDAAMLTARSRSGVLVQLHVAYNCPETLPRRRLELQGTAGLAVAVDTMGQTAGGSITLVDAATGVGADIAIPHADRSPFVGQVEAFADAISGAGAFPYSADHDLAVMALIMRAQRAIEDGGLA